MVRTLTLGTALWAAVGAPIWQRAGVAHAQDRTLVVLRADRAHGRTPKFAARVDRTLQRSLVSDGGFKEAYFSPTPFEDVELLAGCEGPTSSCLGQISTTLGADWVLVRELSDGGSPEGILLTLVAQNGSRTMQARKVVATVSSEGPLSPERVIPRLVRAVYANPSASWSAPEEGKRRDSASIVLRTLGWTGVAFAGALLGTGAGLRVLSNGDYGDAHAAATAAPPNFQEAQSLSERAHRRETASNGLFIAGGSMAVMGLSLLIWDVVRSHGQNAPENAKGSKAANGPRLWAAPMRHGLSLGFSAPLRRTP